MIKVPFVTSLLLLFTVTGSSAQSTNCTQAVFQLQQYATQVNQMYQNEYWSIIPNSRCPAGDQWGRPFNPVVVQNCRAQMLGYLNQWYAQQCNYVNTLYVQITRGCATGGMDVSNTPAPDPTRGSEENVQINTGQIEELTAGVSEEKAVRITIPKTPTGFKPR